MTQVAHTPLKPCPFCGCVEGVSVVSNCHADMSWVSCAACGLEAPTETGVTSSQAVEYWNTRASLEGIPDPSVVGEAIEALRALVDWHRSDDQGGVFQQIARVGQLHDTAAAILAKLDGAA